MPTHSETTAFLRDQRGLPHNKLTVSGFGSAAMKFSRKLQLHRFSSRLVSTAVVTTQLWCGVSERDQACPRCPVLDCSVESRQFHSGPHGGSDDQLIRGVAMKRRVHQ